MKTISFRLTDKQAHYLELIAEKNMRTVEQLIWHTLPFGISCLSQEEISICVEKLPQDWSEKDKKDLEIPLDNQRDVSLQNSTVTLTSRVRSNLGIIFIRWVDLDVGFDVGVG